MTSSGAASDFAAACRSATIADDAEALAFADLYAAAPADLQGSLGLKVARIADATLLMTPGLPSPMFNRAMGLGLRNEAGVAEVEAVTAAYRRAGCANWWLHWNPFAAPADLPPKLPGLGFTVPARRSWAKVLRGTEPPTPITTDLQIEHATDAEAVPAAQAIVTAFEMPPFMTGWLASLHRRPGWTIYAASDGGQVVGGACLYVAGELAWLGMGAVLPSHRRRGGQGVLMTRRIADAIAGGARHIVTETGEPVGDEPNPSLANMKRCGFMTVASRLNFAGPA